MVSPARGLTHQARRDYSHLIRTTSPLPYRREAVAVNTPDPLDGTLGCVLRWIENDDANVGMRKTQQSARMSSYGAKCQGPSTSLHSTLPANQCQTHEPHLETHSNVVFSDQISDCRAPGATVVTAVEPVADGDVFQPPRWASWRLRLSRCHAHRSPERSSKRRNDTNTSSERDGIGVTLRSRRGVPAVEHHMASAIQNRQRCYPPSPWAKLSTTLSPSR